MELVLNSNLMEYVLVDPGVVLDDTCDREGDDVGDVVAMALSAAAGTLSEDVIMVSTLLQGSC